MTREGSGQHRVVVRNRRARHEYRVHETIEAGIVLTGTEVKSVRAGHISLAGGFAAIEDGEAWLHGVYIAPYDQGGMHNPEPRRVRKLLLNRREIDRLAGKAREAGWTLVPLSVYFRRGHAKVELGLARGKQEHDKRAAIRAREERREKDRALREWRRD